MMVRIRLPDRSEASIEAFRWQSENERLASLLNAMLPPWGPVKEDDDSDLIAARTAAKVLGAEIIEAVVLN